MAEESDGVHELVMPFVVCQSASGPYADEPFVAGWECGALDARLLYERPAELLIPLRADSLPQVDLIAMRRGYSMGFEGSFDSEWTSVRLSRG